MPSMPNTGQIFACGSNLHQQIQDHDEDGDPLAITHFVPVVKGDLPVDQVLAVSASQIAYSVTEDCQLAIRIAGFHHDTCVKTEHFDEALQARNWLGRDYFRALLSRKGQIMPLDQGQRSSTIFNAAAMDSHGHVLAISSDHGLRLYNELDDVHLDKNYEVALPNGSELSDVAIYAGAAHFIILLNKSHNESELHTTVLGLGDNRFFQQGHQQPSSWTEAREIDFFDDSGSAAVKVACGDLHTTFLTADGALYMSGSDAKGQCGGFSQREPSLVEWQVDGLVDEEVDVLDVACGAAHTVALTSKGVFCTGSSTCMYSPIAPSDKADFIADNAGQLGTGNTADKHKFEKVALPTGDAVSAVYAAGWNTFVKLQDSA